MPPAPIKLRSIQISNLRSLERLDLEPLPGPQDRGQWLVFLGDNGVGKSTVLRGLVLALCGRHRVSALLGHRGAKAPFIRLGTSQASVEVTTAEGQSTKVELESDERGSEPHRLGFYEGIHPQIPIWAYGCQRGSALGGASREVDFAPLGDIATLFDLDRDLIHAETWLRQLAFAALKNSGGPEEGFFEAVLTTLAAILPGVEHIEVEPDQVWLQGAAFERAPLTALSDGYLTTTGWVLDLVARWSERQRRNGEMPNGDFRHRMTGLVLVDEIDLHLHPRWQARVVGDLRRQFPRLSFVATTHQPMSLLGAETGEIHVLHRDPETQAILVDQVDIPPGTRADQVLTGDWFGLSSTLDADTLGLLATHRRLLREGGSSEDRERIADELRQRLGRFADTSVERLAQSAAAEILDGERQVLTPEDRKKIRARILERVGQQRRSDASL